MQAARSIGIPLSVWDQWAEDDRAWILAATIAEQHLEQAHTDATCPVCGGPRDECQDPANQFAFETSTVRCFRTAARINALEPHKKDPAAAAIAVASVYNPARRRRPGRGKVVKSHG